jgi:sugar-specific transcriptional regulator TrmB
MDLLSSEIGPPKIYFVLEPKIFLERRKTELVQRIQTFDKIASWLNAIKLRESEVVAGHSFRIVRSEEQLDSEASRFFTESMEQIRLVLTSRGTIRLASEPALFKFAFKSPYSRGVKIRVITEVTDETMKHALKIARYCQLRNHPKIDLTLDIFDSRVVFFSASPNLLLGAHGEHDEIIICEDTFVANAFRPIFESMWNDSTPISRYSTLSDSI